MHKPEGSTISRRSLLKAAGTAGAAIALETKAPALLAGAQILNPAAPAERIIPTFCAMCGPGLGCGIYAHVRNGRFTRVEGMKESPLNGGRICAKAHAAPQWVYSPQRLKFPLKRVGRKGEGKFERISWDQAIELIASRLTEQKEKHGPESLAILSPARRSYSEYLYRFLIAHGSPNYGHSGICAMQKSFAFTYTLGAAPSPDIPRSNLIVIWGKQPVYSGSTRGNLKQILDAKDRGAKIISIKPTMEPDVALSDLWIPIRPGTDAVLALAMLHVIIGEKLYDSQFVAQWTYGFDKLADHVRQFSPAWAQPITGLPANQIADLARLYATTKPACIDHGNGLEHAPSSNNAVRAVAILSCMHCAQPACAAVCPAVAISKRPEDGIVTVDQQKCTGCRTCATACPFGAPQYGRTGKMQKCNMCLDRLGQGKQPPCVETCPGEALQFGTLEDLTALAGKRSGERVSAATGPAFLISGKLAGTPWLSLLELRK